MTDIDPATGLPRLEGKMFWRVREQKAMQWFTTSTSEAHRDYTVVELIDPVTFERVQERRILGIKVKNRTPILITEDKVLSVQALWHDGLPVPDDYSGLAIRINDDRYYSVHPSEVTPEMILKAAERALEAYESTRKAEKLLGDYPPKSLNREESRQVDS